MYQISDDRVYSIKRVMSSDNYILKRHNGLKVLTINNLKQKQFTIKQLLEFKDDYANYTDSL